MFGVSDKQDPARVIPAQTRYMEVLNTEELPQGVFHLLAIGSGTIVAEIDGETCHFSGQSVLCLNERGGLRVKAGHATDVKVVSFSPEFLNVNMTPEFLRNPSYHNLCDTHAFFQLSPFLTDNHNKIAFRVCDDTFVRFNAAINQMEKNFSAQPDWYWSCRARSHFIDVINILERIYHNYYLPEPSDDSLYPAKLQKDFREIMVYINNHLHERITLNSLYERLRFNKNKLEKMFDDYMNKSLKEYLDQRRFEEAAYYLRFTSLIGEEIAYRLSFSCSQYFTQFFLRMSGQTPELFRTKTVVKRKLDMEELRRIEVEGRNTREAALFG